jgi:predicted XRE-type DNA-binding protein
MMKFENVWEALANTPEEALNLTFRSGLMTSIEKMVESWNITQAEAAPRLGITRPRLNDLMLGKLSKFSLDALMTLATRAGLKVQLSVKKMQVKRAA